MEKYKIHNTIKLCRFLHNEMTQQELADLTGVTRQTIAAIEKEKYSPTLMLAFQIAHIFGKPLAEVFTFELAEEKGTYRKTNKKMKNKDEPHEYTNNQVTKTTKER